MIRLIRYRQRGHTAQAVIHKGTQLLALAHLEQIAERIIAILRSKDDARRKWRKGCARVPEKAQRSGGAIIQNQIAVCLQHQFKAPVAGDNALTCSHCSGVAKSKT